MPELGGSWWRRNKRKANKIALYQKKIPLKLTEFMRFLMKFHLSVPGLLIRRSAYIRVYIKSLLSALPMQRQEGWFCGWESDAGLKRWGYYSLHTSSVILGKSHRSQSWNDQWIHLTEISGGSEQARLDLWKSVGSKEALTFPYFRHPSAK